MKIFKTKMFELLYETLLLHDKDIEIGTTDKYNNLLYILLVEFEKIINQDTLNKMFKSLLVGIILGILIKSLI
jgi:hypothetical protein